MHEHIPRQVRDVALKEKWVFQCSCKRCLDGKQDSLLTQRTSKITGPRKADEKQTEAAMHEALMLPEKEGVVRTLSWEAYDLSDKLEEWVTQQMQEGDSGGDEVKDPAGSEDTATTESGGGVTLAGAKQKIAELLALADSGELAASHWSRLRLNTMAGDILLGLGDAQAAANHYLMVVENSPDIHTHHVSQRYHAKLGLSLRSAAATLEDEASQDEAEELEKQAVPWLTAARDEMQVLYGSDHWAYLRVCRELEEALSVTIASRCRKMIRR